MALVNRFIVKSICCERSTLLVRLSGTARMISSNRNISIDIKQGTLVGQQGDLPNGNPYYSFKGIPYAVPPLGKLRFKAPVPLEKFSKDVWDCSKEGNKSIQREMFTPDVLGSEDCLFLNVYTPKLKSGKPLAVMVYIHGGGYLFGSADSDFYLPVYLIQEDVVVVTVNYRLNMFGFLSAPDGGIPGNAGLKDQLLALKWVRENIGKFNGDPENITLFGHSAGSSSIHLHLLSKNSRQYFHKAICQSGTSNMEWVMQRGVRERTQRLAKLMSCNSNSEEEIVKFLVETEKSTDISRHSFTTLTADEKRRGLPISFKPVIEAESEEAIVTQPPIEAYKKSNTIDIPVMLGYASQEGISVLFNAFKKLAEIDEDLVRLIPRSLDIEPDDPRSLEIAEEIRQFYFKGERVSKQKVQELCDLMSEYHYNIATHAAAEMHARYQHKSPLYFYRFSYGGGRNVYKNMFGFGKLKGACHGDELFYLFESKLTDAPKIGSVDEQIVTYMTQMWTNFAKYGNPTPDSDSRLPFKWDPVKPVGEKDNFVLDYLEIDRVTKMDQNPDHERIQFWRQIFRKYDRTFLRTW